MESTHQNPPVPLPTEGSSPAALLSATHLFVVSVRSVAGPAWSDTVFERDLRLELVVQEILKGTLDGSAGAHVSLTVRQRQPPEGGYQGIWSHVQPAPAAGVSYLVIARGAATDPAALLIEPALRQLAPADQAADARLAMRAEALRTGTMTDAIAGNARRAEPDRVDPAASASARLVALTEEARGAAGTLYGAYLWERIARSVYDHPASLVPPILAIAGAADTSVGLRAALLDQLLQVAIGLGGETRIAVERALLRVVLVPGAAPLRPKLIDGSLPALLLPDDRAADPASVVLPDPAARRELRAALVAHGTAEAQRLLTWLGPASP